MWFQIMYMGMFVSFMSVLFMVRVWKCNYDIWFCPRDHFHVTFVCVGGIHEVAYDVNGDVCAISVSAIHGEGLEMSL